MPDIDPDVALSIMRKLSGTENYPFHPEGEAHLAEVLLKNCAGVSHARLVIEEFDEAERCPTVEALRSAARRLAEVCECGKAKWAHREGSACKRFMGGSSVDGAPADDGLTKTAGGYAKFRESVPVIPGVPWEVSLQAQSIRIGPRPHELDLYPEACAAIRAGREPDYKLLESQMYARFPWMKKGGAGSLVRAGASDRLKQLDGFARVD